MGKAQAQEQLLKLLIYTQQEDIASLHLLHKLLGKTSVGASPCKSCVQGHWCEAAKGEEILF